MAASYKERRAKNRRGFWDWPKRAANAVINQKVRGTLRVGVYLMVVCLVATGLSARSAWGSVSEQALVTGRELVKLGEFSAGAERLMLNGQPIQVASTVTPLSMKEVLDRFQAVCDEEGAVARDFREVKGLLEDASLAEKGKRANFGVIREMGADDGVIACAVKNPKNGDRRFWDGLVAFAEKWDLAEVGLLRYAYVRKLDSGSTHVLTMWTDGSFRLDAMVPTADGVDAAGSDSPHVGRPPSSVRYLSAAADGKPHAVRIYESKAAASEILGGFERDLGTKGWEAVHAGDEVPEARFFSKSGVDVIVVAQQQGDRSIVSVLETKGF